MMASRLVFAIRNKNSFLTRKLVRSLTESVLRHNQLSSQTDSATVPKFDGHKLKLSDSCIAKLKQISNSDTYLRVTVEGGGCSGFQYKFDLDSCRNDDDVVIERDGVGVIVDETSLEYIKGSTIDYHEELIKSAFRIIDNPLAEQGCSCGASFSVKLE